MPAEGRSSPHGLRFWLPVLLAGHTTSLVAILLLGFVSALVALIPPYLTKLVIDDGLLAGDRQALIGWSLALLGVGAGALALGVLSSLLHMRASVAMLARLREDLLARVLQASARWRAQHSTGELMNRVDADAGEVQRFTFNALLTVTGAVVRLIGALAMLFFLHWPLAVLALALAPLELAFLAWARPRTEALSRSVREARGEFAGRLGESLQALTSIRQIGAARAIHSRLANGQQRWNERQLDAHRFGEVTRTVPALITAVGRSGVFLFGGLAVIDGQIALGTLIAFIGYLGFLVGPMQSLLGLWHAQARARIAFERLESLMTAESGGPLHTPGSSTSVSCIAPDSAPLPLAVWLATDTAEPWVGAGEKVRLEGPSGAGKSSLLRAIQGIDPWSGPGVRVRASDAIPPGGREVASQHIMHVPQRPFVMRGTLAENLRLLAPGASDAELLEVVDIVGLGERFARADGLATRLGEDGLSLSGGERQRLCVARALLCKAGLWLFDEALSEVDRDMARRIWSALDQRLAGATRIIVAHDPSTCEPVDRVVSLGAFDLRLPSE